MEAPTEESTSQIAHVLFVDIVGYSTNSVDAQSRLIQGLTTAIQQTPAFQKAKTKGNVFALATGDGSALVFLNDVASPAHCAVELARALPPELNVRMGIHSGLVQSQTDINGHPNFAGEGLNSAQRIMDFGQAGHILLSAQYASWLSQFDDWRDKVVDLGEGTAKHGQKMHVFALATDGVGRLDVPATIQAKSAERSAGSLNLVIVYKRKAQPDDQVLAMLESKFEELGHTLFIDRHLKIGVEWAKAIEEKIRSADAVIAILSDASTGS